MSNKTYVYNPKNNRAFVNGPNFAKMRGLVPISEEQYNKICKGGTLTAPSQKPISQPQVEIKKEVSLDSPDGTKVEVNVAGATLDQITKDAEREAADALKQSAEGLFGGITKETVTLADVMTLADDKLVPFAAEVFKVNFANGDEADKIRNKLVDIVAKLEKKRAAK